MPCRKLCKQIVYVGIGTGEAFGPGPKERQSAGRFRFFRFDKKENSHCEYIRCTFGTPWQEQDVTKLPNVTQIADEKATLLLGKSVTDRSSMCLSDPFVADSWQRNWLPQHRQNHIEFQQVKLEKRHDDLKSAALTCPFDPTDLNAVLSHAEQCYRHFAIAWLHPAGFSDLDVIRRYYRVLPALRRDEYEILRFEPSLFENLAGDVDRLTIQRVLVEPSLRARWAELTPEMVGNTAQTMRDNIVADLYHYGNHPELRLCSGLLLTRLLVRSSKWDQAVEAAYQRSLHSFSLRCDEIL